MRGTDDSVRGGSGQAGQQPRPPSRQDVRPGLVGQLVAPTDVSECTRMVTWYRYGTPQRLEIVLRDGTRRPARLRPGGMPGDAR